MNRNGKENGSSRGLSTRGDHYVGGFDIGSNGGIIFDGRIGADMAHGVRRGNMVRGTSRKPKKAGNGKI